ncbi:response regulator transcription factor [Brevundimonas subvibrioides]|uniref:Response regulator receiver protein n=1 Tax=Brevundimonas subvibrioides (strain ATCC 15264 / DSM 4735 / LMG 14903 / NBRC 16000 / CB 81) TaxID=633149 RepID=D9QF53_BRESC|nr:response regulator [Brevundimonas subvibrioides]ADL00538.1 response regulator receiver protein [Brevundimonas subvibrioides ATCC 15264]
MKTSILVVDDDENIREVIHAILTQAGFQVAVVSSGEAALAMVKRSRFALMLLDVHMPRMGGLDVMAAMRRLVEAPPVLMVSADSQSRTVREAVALGCVGYVAKPFSPGSLVDRVRRALKQPMSPLMI